MPSASPLPVPRDTRWQRILVLVGIVVLAFNLRPAAISIGPVLGEIIDGLRMSATQAGLLTSLPVVAFGVFGAVAPRLARLVGVHRLTLLALLAVVAGLFGRAKVDSVPAFLGLSLLALAGMATANVLMPSLVKLHFPRRIGLLTAIYSTALAIGITSASVLTVPIADAYGGWRAGILAWALAAGVAALPWLALIRHDRPQDLDLTEPPRTIRLGDVARTRLGWTMAIFFGLQSVQAYAIFGWFAEVYQDAGFSDHVAGILLGVITGMAIPLSLALPPLVARVSDQAPLMWILMSCYPIGYLGLIVAPVSGAWLWAVILGVGTCTFPMILTMIGLRAHTPSGTAALSGFTQSVGYLIAAVGPFAVGLLHDLTGGWTAALLLLTAITAPQLISGLMVSKPAYLEDELDPRTR